MWTLLQELRIAIRTLAQKPKFALLTIQTLALGIGASTVVLTRTPLMVIVRFS